MKKEITEEDKEEMIDTARTISIFIDGLYDGIKSVKSDISELKYYQSHLKTYAAKSEFYEWGDDITALLDKFSKFDVDVVITKTQSEIDDVIDCISELKKKLS